MPSGIFPAEDHAVARAAVAAVVPADDVRFDRGDERRLGAKGRRTRRAILQAAGDVLIEQGWHATTIGAIASRAQVGAGTVYQYFRSKQEVLATIVGEWALAALDQLRAWDPADGRAGLRRIIGRYVSGYAASAGFQAVWEQASLVDPQMAELRSTLTDAYVRTFATAFVAGQEAGLLDAGPDPVETARALCAMTDRYCHEVFVRGAAPADRPAAVVATLANLWAGAIALR